jgi:hypothetical protein
VPSVATRIYPNGRQSYWYQQWGNWLLYKPDITRRLRKQLLDRAGQTRPSYKGAAIYMSPKTDPLLPIKKALTITAQNLDVFLDVDCFLMIQTRPKAVEEKDPDIFKCIVELARQKKVGVSFSISTDLLDEQRKIESGGLAPSEQLRIMARLKDTGVFVSAAVAPLMPYSPDFARSCWIPATTLPSKCSISPAQVRQHRKLSLTIHTGNSRTTGTWTECLLTTLKLWTALRVFRGELTIKALSAPFSQQAGFTTHSQGRDEGVYTTNPSISRTTKLFLGGEPLTQPKFVELAQLPGVKDLPGKVRLHFTKALQAENEGNWLLAEFELNLTMAAEDALFERDPAA